ncbi:MAG: AMP-dependent synthetase [Pelagibacteraceae bacterium]|jgi:long-chain acyl-CoA synthetase|nr:MAG: AMP-dependent synthetase [Pelagibacteraceae bacterium]
MMNKFNNLPELFYFQADKNENNQHLLKLDSNNQVISMSWLETKNLTTKIHNFLANKYLGELERVLLVSENRPEWMASDIAIMSNKLICVPNYTTYTSRDFEHILNDSQPVGLIVSNKNLLQTILTASEKVKYNFKFILCFDYFENNSISNLVFLNDLTDDNNDNNREKIKEIKRKDPACIIYTSGTQGLPKGVILSHGGILSNCEGAYELLKTIKSPDLTFLTWLPLSHSYEHAVQFVQIILEAKVFYNKSIETLLPTVKIAQPHIMTAVPRFYNNLHAKMKINLKNQSNFKQNLFNKTIQLGTKKFKNIKLSFSENIINLILDKLVRKKVKNNFGGRLEAFISGGGPLDSQVGEALNALGLKTLQGYGLTETSPVVSCNLLNKVKVDTVGPIFPGVEVKLAEDGEILVKGENLMLGYWNNKEATEQTIKDGWLHTGDIGEFDEDNYLKITDRKKDIIVSLGGDNIAPSKIENLLTLSPEIEQACVFGEQKNYIAALLVLNSESKSSDEDIQRYIDEVNKDLTQPEKIKKFIFIDEPFSIENNLMTPTMKVRRHEVQKKYQNQIDQLF